jgi:hypothetical protein
VGPDGVLVLLPAEVAAFLDPSLKARIDVPIAGAQAAAITPDAVAIAKGATLHLYARDAVALAGDPKVTVTLEGTISSVGWDPKGEWLASTGERVFRVARDGSSVARLTQASGYAPLVDAVSRDGSRVALRLNDSTLVVLALPSRDTVATIRYLDRRIVGLAFGPGNWLGVGMNLGDGNKIDLADGRVHRTDTHPGRQHHSWLLEVSVEPPQGARPASAPAAAPATPVAPAVAARKLFRDAALLAAGIAIVIALVRLGAHLR